MDVKRFPQNNGRGLIPIFAPRRILFSVYAYQPFEQRTGREHSAAIKVNVNEASLS